MNDDTLILYYYNDGLGDRERRAVEIALKDDANLAARYAELRQQLQQWSQPELHAAPTDMMQRWHDSIDRAAQREYRHHQKPRNYFSLLSFAWGSAVTAALAVGIGSASTDEIDQVGIVPATRLAMGRAIRRLKVSPDCLLIDALRLPEVALPQESIIRGDSISISIAVASIVAKVARDRLMVKMDSRYPGFGFLRNKGYGTPEHLKALGRLGPCPIHRLTFAPVSACRAGLPPLS